MQYGNLKKPVLQRHWENGELWVTYRLVFNQSQHKFIEKAFETIRYEAQEPSLTDSKCFEFIIAQYCQQNGIVDGLEFLAKGLKEDDS